MAYLMMAMEISWTCVEVNILWSDGTGTWEAFDLDLWVNNPQAFAMMQAGPRACQLSNVIILLYVN